MLSFHHYWLVSYGLARQSFKNSVITFLLVNFFFQVKNGVSKAANLTEEISSVDKFEKLQPLESMEAYEEGGEGDGLADEPSQGQVSPSLS